MYIDLTCPAEVFQALLPTKDIPAVSLTLFNLSDRVIVSAEVTLRLLGAGGAEKEKIVFRGRALHGRPRSTFPMNVPCSQTEGIREAEVTLEKIWFADNAVWRRDPTNKVQYTPNALPVSPGLTNLKFVAGETAVGYPNQQQGLWVCVCGRPNPDSDEVCARCLRDRMTVFMRYNREAVEKQVEQREHQLDLNSRSAREDTARLQRIREEEYNRKKKVRKRRQRIAVSFALCAALTAGMLFFGAPWLRLMSARRALGAGETEAARGTLISLGNFLDAPDLLEVCEFRRAAEDAQHAEAPAVLEAAAESLRSSKAEETADGLSAEALAETADFRRAGILLSTGDYTGAREALSGLPEGYDGLAALQDDCTWAEASDWMSRGLYQMARESFLSLGSYPGAAENAAECVYLPAMGLIENGEYDAAIQELSRIPDYRDSRRMTLKCHYMLGIELQESGDLAGAAAEYLMAGDWEDAADRSQDMVYLQAEEAYGRSAWREAEGLYAGIPGWKDSAEKRKACLYALAGAAIKDREYLVALESLNQLPDDYLDTAVLKAQSQYNGGLAAMKRKDYAAALSLLESAAGYRDAEAQALKAREALAQSLLDAGDGEGAAALLEKLQDSKNYEKMKKTADYLMAVKAQEAGADIRDSLARFEALGSFEDSEERVRSLYYILGQQAESRGEVLNAAELYGKAGSWSDAEEKAAAMYDAYYGERVAAARDAMKQGDYALAVTLLESLNREESPKSYRDVNKLYLEACVEAGKALYRAGKPYEGMAFFRMAEADSSAARSWLRYSCYRILGAWTDKDGETVAEFREDGTCEINGETFFFLVPDSFNIRTAPDADSEKVNTFRIGELTETRLTIRDIRPEHDQTWTLRRKGTEAPAEEETVLPGTGDGTDTEAPETEAPQTEGSDFVVEDGE